VCVCVCVRVCRGGMECVCLCVLCCVSCVLLGCVCLCKCVCVCVYVCAGVEASGLTFDCRFAGMRFDPLQSVHGKRGTGDDKPDHQGYVMLLHGFPEWSRMYTS